MGPDYSSLLAGAGKFLAVVVASVVAGVTLGFGLSKLSGNDKSDALVLPPQAASSAATGASGPTAPTDSKPQAPSIRVVSSAFVASTTPSGQQRRRGRVEVRLRVTARDDDADLGTPRLVVGDEQVRVDPNAEKAAEDLLKPIPAGERVTGELRFETTGALTDRLAARPRATLRIGGRSLPLRLTVPEAPSPISPAPPPLTTP